MGLPAWSSVSFDKEQKARSPKMEATRANRSSIRRDPAPTNHLTLAEMQRRQSRVRRRPTTTSSTYIFSSRRPHLLSEEWPSHRTVTSSPLAPDLPQVIQQSLNDARLALCCTLGEARQLGNDVSLILTNDQRNHIQSLGAHIKLCASRLHSDLENWLTNLQHFSSAFRRRSPSADDQAAFVESVQQVTQLSGGNLEQLAQMMTALREAARITSSNHTSQAMAQSALALDICPASSLVSLHSWSRMTSNDAIESPLAHSPVGEFSGLGDRSRSPTPDDSQDPWDTMRITLEPDEHLPTPDSSFTSAVASASFSGATQISRALSTSNSATTSTTDLVIPEHYQVASELMSPSLSSTSALRRTHRRPRSAISQLGRAAGHVAPSFISTSLPFMRMSPSDSRSRSENEGASDGNPSPAQLNFSTERPPTHLPVAPPLISRAEPPHYLLSGPPPIYDHDHYTTLSDPARRRTNAGNPSDIARFALRYTDRLIDSTDMLSDPELQRMRAMLQTVAEDGSSNMNDQEIWIRASLGSSLADDASPQSSRRSSTQHQHPLASLL